MIGAEWKKFIDGSLCLQYNINWKTEQSYIQETSCVINQLASGSKM